MKFRKFVCTKFRSFGGAAKNKLIGAKNRVVFLMTHRRTKFIMLGIFMGVMLRPSAAKAVDFSMPDGSIEKVNILKYLKTFLSISEWRDFFKNGWSRDGRVILKKIGSEPIALISTGFAIGAGITAYTLPKIILPPLISDNLAMKFIIHQAQANYFECQAELLGVKDKAAMYKAAQELVSRVCCPDMDTSYFLPPA
jgi:hypothetical protein